MKGVSVSFTLLASLRTLYASFEISDGGVSFVRLFAVWPPFGLPKVGSQGKGDREHLVHGRMVYINDHKEHSPSMPFDARYLEMEPKGAMKLLTKHITRDM